MFKPGDKFIRFSPYGSITIGEVAEYGEVRTVDINNGVVYLSPYIVTIKRYVLQLDGSDGKIFKVIKELTSEDIDAHRKYMAMSKQEKINHIQTN